MNDVQDKQFEVVIEISANSSAVKYEVDKATGKLFVDRIMRTAMHYPCNYGFIPNTLSGDGDPCDCLVISSFPIINGASVKCRVVGALLMEDEGGKDEKILCLPDKSIDPFYKDINDINDISKEELDRIQHFFEHYKDKDPNKWVKIGSWENAEYAHKLIKIL